MHFDVFAQTQPPVEDYRRARTANQSAIKQPSPADLDNGDLKCTTDSRSVCTTVLNRWLEAPAEKVRGRAFENAGIMAPPALTVLSRQDNRH